MDEGQTYFMISKGHYFQETETLKYPSEVALFCASNFSRIVNSELLKGVNEPTESDYIRALNGGGRVFRVFKTSSEGAAAFIKKSAGFGLDFEARQLVKHFFSRL